MVAAMDGVNDARLDHDQWHDRIRRLVHDMHYTPEALGIRCDAGKGVGHPSSAFRMQQDCVRLVTGARLTDRLTRTGDRRGLRRPILAAFSLRLQRVVPRRHAARLTDEPVFFGAKSPEISLPSVNVHHTRRTAIRRIIPLHHHPDPSVSRALGFLTGIRLWTGLFSQLVEEVSDSSS